MCQPILETDRLRLRPLKPSDAGLIALYAGDERVARMTTNIPHPYPPGGAAAYIERVLSGGNGETVWAIDHMGSSEEQLIGVIGLRDRGEIGYWIGAPFWSTGFATEAVEAVIAYAHSRGIGGIYATVFQDNPASAQVLTKAGLDYVGDDEGFSAARGASVQRWIYRLPAA